VFQPKTNPIPQCNLPVFQAFEEDLRIQNFAPRTIGCYMSDLGTLFHFLNGNNDTMNQQVLWVGSETLSRYFADLVEQQYSQSSIARKVSSLRLFYAFCLEHLYITDNPMETIPSPKLAKRVPSTISLEDIEKIITVAAQDTLRGYRDKALLELLAFTGITVGELANIEIKDVNIDKQIITIKGKERTVQLTERLCASLKEYIDKRQHSSIANVFLNKFDQKLSTRSMRRNLDSYALGAGIQTSVSPYMLRHSFARRLAEQGTDIIELKNTLGHKGINSVRVYMEEPACCNENTTCQS
jgi:site-specific recombinase XerD